jgi:hypothetical protein
LVGSEPPAMIMPNTYVSQRTERKERQAVHTPVCNHSSCSYLLTFVLNLREPRHPLVHGHQIVMPNAEGYTNVVHAQYLRLWLMGCGPPDINARRGGGGCGVLAATVSPSLCVRRARVRRYLVRRFTVMIMSNSHVVS